MITDSKNFDFERKLLPFEAVQLRYGLLVLEVTVSDKIMRGKKSELVDIALTALVVLLSSILALFYCELFQLVLGAE